MTSNIDPEIRERMIHRRMLDQQLPRDVAAELIDLQLALAPFAAAYERIIAYKNEPTDDAVLMAEENNASFELFANDPDINEGRVAPTNGDLRQLQVGHLGDAFEVMNGSFRND